VYKQVGKTLFDQFFALLLLLIFSPIMLIVFLLVKMQMGSPIFFTQERPGKDEKIFKIYKFRTMSNECNEKGELLADEKRLHRVGLWIRTTSLDELPQLWNVLKGEMSFVGPRPLLIEYLPLYNEKQKKRHEVKPGITGWAQVNGRNAISWEQKFEYDIWYRDHQSFSLDMKILWMTFLKVINRNDISSDTHVTMKKFEGNT
jgi:undecaprenyl phosphate N,N'-diacetylbacillosamine 1-phosphate transferase